MSKIEDWKGNAFWILNMCFYVKIYVFEKKNLKFFSDRQLAQFLAEDWRLDITSEARFLAEMTHVHWEGSLLYRP